MSVQSVHKVAVLARLRIFVSVATTLHSSGLGESAFVNLDHQIGQGQLVDNAQLDNFGI